MPKTVVVSLSGIVNQINLAEGQLSGAKNKAKNLLEKHKLAVKIKNLKKIKKLVQENCPKGKKGLNVVVPI